MAFMMGDAVGVRDVEEMFISRFVGCKEKKKLLFRSLDHASSLKPATHPHADAHGIEVAKK
jgi:hypothetical protein